MSASTSTSTSALPTLRQALCQLPSSVCTAGPQPGTKLAQCAPLDLNLGPSQLSVHRWTSTWDLPSSVCTAGPQPGSFPAQCAPSQLSVHLPSSVCTAGPQRPDRTPEDMPDRVLEDMSDRMPEDMPDKMPWDMPDRMPEDIPDRMPEDMPDRMREGMPNRMPDKISDRLPQDMPDRVPEGMPDRNARRFAIFKCIHVMVGITRSKVIEIHLFLWIMSHHVTHHNLTTFKTRENIKKLHLPRAWISGWSLVADMWPTRIRTIWIGGS